MSADRHRVHLDLRRIVAERRCERDGAPWRVDVAGGTCRVVWHPDGTIELSGPALIVAEFEVDEAWLAAVSG